MKIVISLIINLCIFSFIHSEKSNKKLGGDKILSCFNSSFLIFLKKSEELPTNCKPESKLVKWESLTKNEKSKVSGFWNDFQNRLRVNNKDSVLQLFKFPLNGEWGFVMGLKKEGNELSKDDFIKGYDSVFNDFVRNQLLNQEVFFHVFLVNGPNNSLFAFESGVELKTKEGFENSRFFRFCLTEEGFKLCSIWHAG